LSLGAVECLCGRRGISRLKKVIIVGKKYQASLSHHQPGRRPSFVFDFLLPGPVFIPARDFILYFLRLGLSKNGFY
jgi:hypothetical protein